MAGVFDVLGEDHVEVQRICADLRGEESRDVRLELIERLIVVESRHEAIEEEYFWPYVRERVAGGAALADTATSQEEAAKYVLDALRHKKGYEEDFEPLIQRFLDEGPEHIGYEENEVWPKVREMITPEEDTELGEKLRRAKQIAPTRPHPGTPPKPAVLKSAGTFAAMLDRVRDAITGRGR